MKPKHTFRVHILSGMIVVIAIILISRLYMIQIVQGEVFSDQADRQYVRPSQNLFDRGIIFFEDKNKHLVSGATLKTGYTLALNPNILVNPQDAFEKINPLVPLDEEMFFARAAKKGDPYEEVAYRIEPELADSIAKLDITGVNVYKDRWRFYPGNTLAAQTLGFVAYSGDKLEGVYGIERYYDDTLSRDTENVYVNFFAEVFANLNKTIFNRSSEHAGDVVTSLEPTVQLFLENQLRQVQTTLQSNLTAGVILNPQSGEIYAMAVFPTFDLNGFQDVDNVDVFSNAMVENVYEMGSIIKPLTVAAGLDSGVITPETMYTDYGSITLNGYTVSNYDGKGRGRVNMQEVLNQSLNTGAAFVVGKMGNDVFGDYMRAFGFGEETGIDLPNESAGLIQNLKSSRDIEYATASFGQGIAMTPIATVRALSAIANGGVLITPHIAKKIKYKNGLSKEISFNDGKRVIAEETSEDITRMLVHVVDHSLLGGTVKLQNYSVAAKTGTAQIAKKTERGYYDDRFLHSFFGYFPAYDPEFLIFLLTLEPQGVRFASQTLTHPFIDTVRFLANYYQIPPDR